MKRLGVVGTMVWDTIYGRDPEDRPVEEWGGIAYALSALEATLDDQWELVPLIKVGRDLAAPANDFLRSLTHRTASGRFVEVAEPNNRVTLRYDTAQRRTECLAGGVPPWTWPELGPMVRDIDALYVNFISGFELTLETATHLRHGFDGPIYADLHSLLLGVGPDGFRFPRPLARSETWFRCFDAVQCNESEIELFGGDPMAVAAGAITQGVRLLVVTLGPRGAVYFAAGVPVTDRTAAPPPGPIRTARVPGEPYLGADADPTGCGDVFGASLFAELLCGAELESAIASANRRARRNLTHRGATNLHYHLRGEIAPR